MSKILIVEDEEAIADLEKDYLELSGFEVEIENDGDRGLERALKEEFDMFILDLMLPGTDGFEICKKIREVKNTPILMVSAKKDDIDKIRGLGLGADDYITKPFSPSELVARVKAHLARYERLIGSNVQENDIIEIRGIRIDKTARRVWVNAQGPLRELHFRSKQISPLRGGKEICLHHAERLRQAERGSAVLGQRPENSSVGIPGLLPGAARGGPVHPQVRRGSSAQPGQRGSSAKEILLCPGLSAERTGRGEGKCRLRWPVQN